MELVIESELARAISLFPDPTQTESLLGVSNRQKTSGLRFTKADGPNLNVRTKRHNQLMKVNECGYCGSTTGVREIIWGMPEGEPDPSKYLIGGCCISENDPTHECIECGWQRIVKRENPLGFSL